MVLSLALCGEASAGNIVSFSGPTSFTLPSNPASVAVGDFNGDLDPDLAVANDASSNVSILVGGAGAGFSGPTNYAAGGGATSVAVGDFNGDLDLDLAVANTQGGVSILLGGTGATFSTPSSLSAGSFPAHVSVGEFNGDSDPDLAVANQGADTVSILTGATAARFVGPTDFPVGDVPNSIVDGPNSIAVRDFNGDLDPDLAVTNKDSDRISVLTGGTGASFSAPANIAVGDFPTSVASGDFNGDSDPDLAVANQSSSSVSILVGATGATFAAPTTLSAGARSVAVGDFNSDSDPDLAVGGNSANNLSFLIGAAGATFGSPQVFAAGGEVESVAVGDFNGDALPDVAGANYFTAKASALTNTSDLTPPDTTIASGPSGPTNDSTPTFGFSSSESGASFQCRVDGAAFAPCSSPHTTAALGEGAHTFEVRATDAAGNLDATPASRSFTVDSVAPDTTIASGPSGPTNDSTPAFGFSSSEPGASFQCRVDGAAFAPCSSPHTTAALSEGAHTFEVRATDAAGNLDATPASRSFTVDSVAPDTTIASGPSGPTNDSTPTFGFSSSESGSSLECRVDGGAFAACSSPHTTAALGEGAHKFEVRATDALGNLDATPASRSFTVDSVAPDTAISSGPSGATNDATPTFDFGASESGSSLQCRVDEAAFAACSSPHTTGALGDGAHTFEARATDAAGNVDQTPASRSLTVDTRPPKTTITAGPPGIVDDATPTFSFISDEPGSTFRCRVDGGALAACSSPHTTAALGEGPHSFEVGATDPAGNEEPILNASPGAGAAALTFTVQAALPQPVLGRAFNVEPVSGEVFVSPPPGLAATIAQLVPGLKGRDFIPLSEARQVPIGSLLDTRRGVARITSARAPNGATQSGDFLAGVFQVLQSRKAKAKGLTELRLKGSSFRRCRGGGKAAQAAGRSRRTIRRLRSRARGRFRTRGRHSAATVRGTAWLTADRCDGTLTRVSRGRVAVRDLRRRKTVLVRAGKSYLARARR